MASGILKYEAAAVTLWSVETNEGILKENKWLLQQEQMQVRRPAILKLSWERLQKRLFSAA
jgi:hypothetical protein